MDLEVEYLAEVNHKRRSICYNGVPVQPFSGQTGRNLPPSGSLCCFPVCLSVCSSVRPPACLLNTNRKRKDKQIEINTRTQSGKINQVKVFARQKSNDM